MWHFVLNLGLALSGLKPMTDNTLRSKLLFPVLEVLSSILWHE